METNRNRRAIKTPKRFDDEAFETPQRQPEPSIIKVRLPHRPIKIKTPKSHANSTTNAGTTTTPTVSAASSTTTTAPPTPTTTTASTTTTTTTTTTTPAPIVTTTSTSTINTAAAATATTTTTTPATTASTPIITATTPKHELKPESPEKESPLPTIKSRLKRPPPPVFADIVPNTILPFWDARTAAEEHEDDNVKEVVHCQCNISEELGLMVQCETCLTWQHAQCLGIEKAEDAPDGYTCKACIDPYMARDSRRYAYDQDWLVKGRMKMLKNGPQQANVESLQRVNSLINRVISYHKVLHSLRVKRRILSKAGDEDPELKVFRNQWSSAEVMEVTPESCRKNLEAHIESEEKFLESELTKVEEELELLEKTSPNITVSLETLKDDLNTMRSYCINPERSFEDSDEDKRLFGN